MKTDNELIAKFMGMIQNPYDKKSFSKEQFYVFEDGEHLGVWEYPAFHTSWDWIMPVVEKINRLDDQIHLSIRGIELIRTIRKKNM